MEFRLPIFLTGFMGAGKSTVGRRLAECIGCEFADTDACIEEQAGKSIPRIFAEDGEAAFRQMETAVLRTLPAKKNIIYATGGGIVTSDINRSLLAEAGTVVYLRADWATLASRLADASGRPLLASAEGRAAARDLFESRIPSYETADLVVDTDNRSVEDIVELILAALKGGSP